MAPEKHPFQNDDSQSRKESMRLQLAEQLCQQTKVAATPATGDRAARQRARRIAADARTIICVDDEPSVLELAASVLEPEGFRVITASSVAEARELLQTYTDTALVITDLRMPTENGFALLEFMKANLRFQRIPVIVLTSCSDPRYVRKAIESGAADYLAKPFTSELLLCRVNAVFATYVVHIALVSDCEASRIILGRDLTLANYVVHTAATGAEAKVMLTTNRANLLIVEFVLPDMTGLDLLAWSSDQGFSVPVVFISDPLFRVSDELVKAAGGYGLIHRPFRNAEIVQLIRSIQLRPQRRKADAEG